MKDDAKYKYSTVWSAKWVMHKYCVMLSEKAGQKKSKSS